MELQKEKGRSGSRFPTSRGGILIDAALVLPIFILSMVLILSMMKEAHEESRLYKELCRESVNISYAADLMDAELPFLFASGETETHHVSRTLFYRPFWGESEAGKEEYSLVCIYPKAGIKYHQKCCSTVENNKNYEVITLKEAQERGYLPCKLCYGGPDYFLK